MSVGIVILAAGEAKRFGSAKLVVTIDGVPLVRRAALAALATTANVIVVSGAHREAVEACIADLAVVRVFNALWAQGLGASIACGVSALDRGQADLNAAIITLADQPLIGTFELNTLIAAHAKVPTHIIAAQYAGVLGPPCLFPRAYFPELTSLHGKQGARAVLRRHADLVDAIAMPAAACDIDTPEDYRRLADT
jgi:molybdenum cofactor cytidylyltransferase